MNKSTYATNNKYKYFPPIMNDGRNFTTYQPGANLSNNIKEANNIKSNWDYRKYMMRHADNIIKHNQKSACKQSGYCPYNMSAFMNLNSGKIVGEPLISIQNKNGLRQKYLTRNELETRMAAPYLKQEDYIKSNYANPN